MLLWLFLLLFSGSALSAANGVAVSAGIQVGQGDGAFHVRLPRHEVQVTLYNCNGISNNAFVIVLLIETLDASFSRFRRTFVALRNCKRLSSEVHTKRDDFVATITDGQTRLEPLHTINRFLYTIYRANVCPVLPPSVRIQTSRFHVFMRIDLS